MDISRDYKSEVKAPHSLPQLHYGLVLPSKAMSRITVYITETKISETSSNLRLSRLTLDSLQIRKTTAGVRGYYFVLRLN